MEPLPLGPNANNWALALSGHRSDQGLQGRRKRQNKPRKQSGRGQKPGTTGAAASKIGRPLRPPSTTWDHGFSRPACGPERRPGGRRPELAAKLSGTISVAPSSKMASYGADRGHPAVSGPVRPSH